jgi:hypothetical protein
MGEIAESMLDGSMCELCGEYLGEAVGDTRRCSECNDDEVDPSIDTFRILKKQNQEKRAHNRHISQVALTERGYEFEVKNGDAHLIVQTARGVVDFWPGTGKFRVRASGHISRGLQEFLEHCPARQQATVADQAIQWAPHMTPFAIKTYVDAGFKVVGAPTEAA